MSVKTLTLMSPAQQQILACNNSGGPVARNEFSLPADTAFAVFGTLVADGMVVGDVPAMEGLFEALDEITNAEPLQWGQAPAEILINDGLPEPSHEMQLSISVLMSQEINIGGGKSFFGGGKLTPGELIKPPLGKTLVVWGAVVPDDLNQARIATLKAAVEGVTGVTSYHHLVDGKTDAELVGTATVLVTAQITIKRIPVEPEEP